MDKYLKRKKIFVAPKAPPVVESPPPTEEMSTPTSKKLKQEVIADQLEVTGVSRSGRVRKKSSKLTDFESPDEIDPRYKRKADRLAAAEASMSEASPVVATPTSTPKPKKSAAGKKAAAPPPPPPPVEDSPPRDLGGSDEEEVEEEEESYTHGMKAVPDFDSDPETSLMYGHTEEVGEEEEEPSSGEESADDGTANSEEEIDDDIDDDDDEGQLVMVDDPKPSRPANQSMSLYMLEKSSKKRLVVLDGKIIGRKKAQRKDKGKSRFTAYMLWAKEARKEIVRSNPDMDFSTTSKRLGELWSIVPNSEKYSWRRRAKRMSVKQKADECKAAAAAAVAHTPASTGRKFINKASPPAAAAKMTSPPRKQDWKRQERRASNSQGQLGTLAAAAAVAQQQQQLQLQQQQQQQQLQNALAAAATDVKECTEGPASVIRSGVAAKPTTVAEAQAAGLFKAVGTSPVDVAAHLKLLGESLAIIGERLKEHEGQIAVSGSFSVLLDSLLCAMAPLLCLTQQVPELNGCPAETLSQTLDNIAYIMPGL